jgi:deazaflavin-dependent oxidoreductase (nitroreductase family)
MYKMSQPGRPDLSVSSLLLTTTGRKSGEQFIFPLFYGKTVNSYIVVASKDGAPQHPGRYRNILANPEVEVQVGTAKLKVRARTAAGDERARLCSSSGRPTRLPEEDRARDPGGRAGSRPLTSHCARRNCHAVLRKR